MDLPIFVSMEKLYLPRRVEAKLLDYQQSFPAVVIIGPRQVGKTSLVRSIRSQLEVASIYLDLERPRDLNSIEDLEYFAGNHEEHVVILDEIQRKPTLFPELRSIIDEDRRSGRFILLGSATLDLIRDASESLAGRIAILELSGLTFDEIGSTTNQLTHWLRGGFPDSLLAESDIKSADWREFFVRTYLERDLISYGIDLNAGLMSKLLSMLAYVNGQMLNYTSLAKAIGIDVKTVKRYVQFLEQTYLIRLLPAYHANVGKRLIKTPKIYFRDTGILHYLLGIEDGVTLLSHPNKGESFETYVLEQLGSLLPRRTELSFYRTSNGAEIDVLILSGGLPYAALEIKSAFTANVTKGFYSATDDVGVDRRFLVAPGEAPAGRNREIQVISVNQLPLLFD